MRLRPCIDIHNGKVKQIIGGTLKDQDGEAEENFVAGKGMDAAYYADLYKRAGLYGGHIILLNGKNSEYYDETKEQAFRALKEFPGGMQIGGGINADNALEYLNAGASHVIVTSYVFSEGKIHYEKLKQISQKVDKSRLVLDLSCKKMENNYRIMTNRWQKMADTIITEQLLEKLSLYCDEFLVHAVDVEGKVSGIEKELTEKLGKWNKIPMTYAGGVSSMEDLEELYHISAGKLDVTIGSALDLFGGMLAFQKVINFLKDKPSLEI